jgi:hypothetical protein
MTRAASSPKYGRSTSGTASPMIRVRPARRLRAATFTRYPSRFIASSTVARVASRT